MKITIRTFLWAAALAGMWILCGSALAQDEAPAVSETQVIGYEASTWGGDCAANGSLITELGKTYTCTVTVTIPRLTYGSRLERGGCRLAA